MVSNDETTPRRDFDELKALVVGTERTLRGYNGEQGLVGQVKVLQQDMNHLREKDLPAMQKDILDEVNRLSEKAVQWPNLAKGFVAPVVIAVVTALIVTVLHAWLFP